MMPPLRTLLNRTLALCLIATAVQAGPVQIVFVGDIMLDDGPGQVIAAGRDPLAAFAPHLAAADLRIGNLETPIATTGKPTESKIYNFRAHPRVLPVLQGRFDALSVANNHSGDYGAQAFMETLAHVKSIGITPFGGGRNLVEAHRPYWAEKNGLRIAILAYNEFKPRSFAAGPHWAGVAWSEDSLVVADIRAARAAGADIVIPYMHWGWEREPEPTLRQRNMARLMIDAGADAVIGNHPHVTQGTEIYRDRLIVYSLGNFVFDGFELPAAKLGWLLTLTVDETGVKDWHITEAAIDAEGTPTPRHPH